MTRKAMWDLNNERVSIPITNEMVEIVKRNIDNLSNIVWELKVREKTRI